MSVVFKDTVAWCLTQSAEIRQTQNHTVRHQRESHHVFLPADLFSSGSFPSFVCLCPSCSEVVLRLFRRTGTVPWRGSEGTGGLQSLALFRLTAGVISLLTHWVAAPFSRRDRQDSSFAVRVCVSERVFVQETEVTELSFVLLLLEKAWWKSYSRPLLKQPYKAARSSIWLSIRYFSIQCWWPEEQQKIKDKHFINLSRMRSQSSWITLMLMWWQFTMVTHWSRYQQHYGLH